VSTVRGGESHYGNIVAGPDMYLKVARDHEIRAQWVFSQAEYPVELLDALCEGENCDDPGTDSGLPGESAFTEQVLRVDPDKTYGDDAWSLKYRFRRRSGYLSAVYRDVGEDFRGDLGYLPRVDYRSGSLSGGLDRYFPYKDKGQVRMRLSGNYFKMESQHGESINDAREVWISYWGLLQSWVRLGYRDRDRVAKRFLQNTLQIENNAPEFNEDQFLFRAESAPLRNGRLILAGRLGEQIDTDNYRLGDQIEFEPELRWNVGDHVELALKETYRQLDADGMRIFVENYLTLNLTYQLKVGTFLRLTIVDDYTKREPDNYLFEDVDETERDTTGELLFAWKPTQYNTFLVGVKLGAEESDQVDDLKVDESNVYIKYSRAFRP
jgi:hypothetical protein